MASQSSFIRTRSMSSKQPLTGTASSTMTQTLHSPPMSAFSTLSPIPPTPRIPLQEALLNLARDGRAPVPASSTSSSVLHLTATNLNSSFQIQKPTPSYDAAENPFLVKGLASAVGRKRKVYGGEENENDADDEGSKRVRADKAATGNGNEGPMIDFLSLTIKRPRSPFDLPDPLSASVEDDADGSPRKRPRPSPSPTRALPLIDLANPPPSPTRPRSSMSPTKFNRVPQFEMKRTTSGSGEGIFATVVREAEEAKKKKETEEKERERPRTLADEMEICGELENTEQMCIDPALLGLDAPTPMPEPSPMLVDPPPIPTSASIPALTPADLFGPGLPFAPPPPTPFHPGPGYTSPPPRVNGSRLPVRTSRLRSNAISAPSPVKTRAYLQRHPPPPPPPELSPAKKRAPSAYRPPPSAAMNEADMSMKRTTSLSTETQASLSTLSAALSKLALPPPPSSRSFARQSLSTMTPSGSIAPPRPRMMNVQGPKRRPSTAAGLPPSRRPSVAFLSSSTSSAAPVEGDAALGASARGNSTIVPLAGCVVFVDVRTKDGEDGGRVFVEMLKQLGARILKSPSASLTHLVLKSPSPTTIARYRLLGDPKPEAVAVGWVVRCAEENRLVAPDGWRLDLSVGGGVVSCVPKGSGRESMATRRRSMEPRRVELLDEVSLSIIIPPVQEQVERAKRRSLLYQPHISSPLRGSFIPERDADDDNNEKEKENVLAGVGDMETEGKLKGRGRGKA